MTPQAIATYIVVSFLLALLVILKINKHCFLDMTKSGWRRAKKEAPEVAERLGLSFSEAKLDYKIGVIQGEYQGRQVKVSLDSASTIQIALDGTPSIELSTSRPHGSPPEGMVTFETGSSDFDRFFRIRYASPKPAEDIARSEKLSKSVIEFRNNWSRELNYLVVSYSGIRCSLKYGWGTYIPANVIEKILPDLCRLASAFESVLRSG